MESNTKLKLEPEFRHQFNKTDGELLQSVWEQSQASQRLLQGLTLILKQTDARTLAVRIESSVWNDLQYIRVNGALVGGIAGLLLELLGTLHN